MAINAGMASELKAHLQTVDVSAFDEVRSRFVQELSKRGMQVKELTDLVKPEDYPETQGEGGSEVYPRNLASLAQKQGIDVLVLLSIRRYGTIRSYYGFIPLGAPKALLEAQGQMVDLRTSKLLWQATEEEARASVVAGDPWDQPPSYPNLTAALRTAVDAGKDYLQKEFFAPEAGGT